MRIILTVDDTDASTDATQAMAGRSWPPGTRVLVLAVVPRHGVPPPPPPMLMALRGDWHRPRGRVSHARVQVGLVVAAISSRGLEAEGQVRLGNSRAEILRAAHEWSADLIVVGSCGRSGLRRLFGCEDLAASLVASVPCSVRVIRGRELANRCEPQCVAPVQGDPGSGVGFEASSMITEPASAVGSLVDHEVATAGASGTISERRRICCPCAESMNRTKRSAPVA